MRQPQKESLNRRVKLQVQNVKRSGRYGFSPSSVAVSSFLFDEKENSRGLDAPLPWRPSNASLCRPPESIFKPGPDTDDIPLGFFLLLPCVATSTHERTSSVRRTNRPKKYATNAIRARQATKIGANFSRTRTLGPTERPWMREMCAVGSSGRRGRGAFYRRRLWVGGNPQSLSYLVRTEHGHRVLRAERHAFHFSLLRRHFALKYAN